MAVTQLTSYPSVRYRDSTTRKNGIKADRYFLIRYVHSGKRKEEGVGWSSEGMTALKASGLLAMLKENIRFGRHPQTVAEMRDMEKQTRKEQAHAEALAQRNNISFQTFWTTDYLPACAAKTKRTMSYEAGMSQKWIFPVIGDLPLRELTVRHIEEIQSTMLTQEKSPATVAKVFGIISQVWNTAVHHDIVVGESPTKRVKKPRKDNRRIRFLSHEETKLLLNALKKRSQDIYESALLSLFAGLRAGEIHNLTWGDINLPAGEMCIRDPKNGTNRHAYITPEIREVFLNRAQGKKVHPADYVFPATHGGKRKWVSDTFERTVLEIGLNTGICDPRQKVVFHSLRHTFASWLVQKGTPIYTVAKLMGHSDTQMTERYSHLAPDTVRSAAMSLAGELTEEPAQHHILQFTQHAV